LSFASFADSTTDSGVAASFCEVPGVSFEAASSVGFFCSLLHSYFVNTLFSSFIARNNFNRFPTDVKPISFNKSWSNSNRMSPVTSFSTDWLKKLQRMQSGTGKDTVKCVGEFFEVTDTKPLSDMV
jgi:hypothetical protein